MTIDPGWVAAAIGAGGVLVATGVNLQMARGTKETLTKIEKVLFGNGQPGLCHEQAALKASMLRLEAICRERHEIEAPETVPAHGRR